MSAPISDKVDVWQDGPPPPNFIKTTRFNDEN